MSLWCVLGLSIMLLFSCVAGDQCPSFQLDPPVLVVEYNDSLEVNCSTSSSGGQLYWSITSDLNVGNENQLPFLWELSAVWTEQALQAWDVEAHCILNGTDSQCKEELSITIYKLPDSISVTLVNQTEIVDAGGEYELQCNVMNVAPVEHLTVYWYKENVTVNESRIITTEAGPQNVTTSLKIFLMQDLPHVNSGPYWCEAELDLGPHGPQPPPRVSSNQLNITVHQTGCPVVISPPSLVVRYGEPALATCRALVPTSAMGWNSTVGAVGMEEGVKELNWTVKELREWTVGPQCVISMEDGYECSTELPITIYNTPDRLPVTLNHPGAMAAGKEDRLHCYIENIAPVQNLIVRWFKGSTQLIEDLSHQSSKVGPQNITSELLVRPEMSDNEAQYRCEADLNLGPRGPPKLKSVPFSVTVYTGCPVEISPPSLVVRYGEPALATCRALVPTSAMGWESTIGAVGMEQGVKELNWTVKELREWTVQPQCIINPEEGDQCAKDLKVSIYNTPNSLLVTSNRHGPMAEGKSYTLHCYIENIAPVQNLTVRWFKGDKELMENLSHQKSKVGPENITSTYTFYPSLSDNGAQYRCEAELALGPGSPPKLTSDPFNITVYSGCPIVISPPTLVVKYGESASANCSTFVPHNGIGWNSTLEPVDAGKDVESVNWSVKELREWTLNPKCVIDTDDGQCEKDLSVVVYSFPDFISIAAATSPEVIEGREYRLLCLIQDIAPVQNLTVKWFKRDTEMRETQLFPEIEPQRVINELWIKPVMSDNGAQYRCEAELALGPGSPPKLTSDLFNITVYSGCPVVISPPSLVVRYGEPALATCRTLVPTSAMGWNSTVGAVGMEERVWELNWTVKELREWTVRPQCVISMEDGYECSTELPIIVYNTPDSLSVTSYPPGAIAAGRNYTLHCHIENIAPVQNLTVRWFKGSTKLVEHQQQSSRVGPLNITFDLQIVPVMSDNGAQYRCEAELNLGPGGPPKLESDPFTITVYTGCPVVISPPSLVVRYGETALATCRALVPTPGMGWESTIGAVGMEEGVKELNWTVKELTEWTVEPQCYINTDDDQCLKGLDVTVYNTPNSLLVTSNRHGPMAEGKSYTLHCYIENIAPVQNLTVRWFKGDKELMEDVRHQKSKVGPENITSTYTFYPSLSDNGAQYRCEAELALGPGSPPKLTSDPFNITVYSGCPIVISPPTLVVKYGESASANCSTFVPHNGIGWNSTLEPVDAVKDVKSVNWSVKELREWTLNPKCVIDTDDGQCEKDLSVVVYSLPDTINMTTAAPGVMTAGHDYTLTCHIQNVAPAQNLTIRWFKGSVLVKEDHGPQDTSVGPRHLTFDLHITPDTSDDGAQYRCEAQLDLDSAVVQIPKLTSKLHAITVAGNWWIPIVIILIILCLLILFVLFIVWYRKRRQGNYSVVQTDIPLANVNGKA